MRTPEPDVHETTARLHDLPQFDLEFVFDDSLDPSEVTIFEDGAGDRTTTWITADVDVAIGLDSIA